MSVKIRDTSRLRFARLITIDSIEHWEMPEYPIIESAPDDILYTVDGNDKIDALAVKFYDAEDLWWVIALANGMELLPTDLVPNTQIRIPSGIRVFQTILRNPSRGVEGR